MSTLDDWTTVSLKGLLPATGQTAKDVVAGLGDAYMHFLMADAVLPPPVPRDDPTAQIAHQTDETRETHTWEYELSVETRSFGPGDEAHPGDDWGNL